MLKKQRLVRAIIVSFCGLGGIAASATATAQGPFFTGVGDLPGNTFHSIVNGLSDDGSTAVGTSLGENGFEAFRWRIDSGIQGLGDLPGGYFYSSGIGVSPDGSVIVGKSASEFRPGGSTDIGREAFRWTEATGMVGLGDLPGEPFASYASDTSADGAVVVGRGNDQAPDSGFIDRGEAFRWTGETGMVGLGSLPGGVGTSTARAVSADGAVVVGDAVSGGLGAREAFRWTEQTGMVGLGGLPGANVFESQAFGISADGQFVVGWTYSIVESGQAQWVAVLWNGENEIVELGDLPGGDDISFAWDVSADGSTVVGYGTTDAGLEASIWDEENGMRALTDVLESEYGLDLGGWRLISARGVSDDGLVFAGYGINPEGFTEGWVASIRPIPIPAALPLFVSALFALGLVARRRAA